jgi:dihydropteroate synthase
VVISVDTRSAAVAENAIASGAQVINDISGGSHDPAILQVTAQRKAGIILMHLGEHFPQTPPRDDPDIVSHVKRELRERLAAAMNAGIGRENIALDPGIGFGKTMADNWRLALAHWGDLAAECGGGVVMGSSRKRFLETAIPGDLKLPQQWDNLVADLHGKGVHPRDAASAAVVAAAAAHGVGIHRVHDVALAKRAFEWAGNVAVD